MKKSELLSEIALAFVGRDGFDAQMGNALKAIGTFLDVSRSYVFLDDSGGTTTRCSHEWCAVGIKSRNDGLRGMDPASPPSWRRLLDEQGLILSTDIRTLPEDIRKLLEPLGILSLLVYPLFIKDAIAGFIGVDECSRSHNWKKAELDLLKTASGIISTVLGRTIGKGGGQGRILSVAKDLNLERETLQKFTKLFENNPALMAISHLEDGIFTDVNEAFLNKLGYSRTEVIGQTRATLKIFVHSLQRRRIGIDMVSAGRITDVEVEIRRKDGKVLDGLLSGEILDIQGKKYFLTVTVDITEQIDLREKLEAQRQRLCNIIDGARLGTWEWNVQTGEAIFNERWAEIAGYTLAELEPLSIATWEGLTHPEDLRESNRLLARHFAGESKYYDFESRIKHKSGHWIWVVARGKVIEWSADRKPVKMFGTFTDITEKKELEERVRQMSIRDCLTEVYNRRYVFDRLEVLAAEYSRLGKNFCISILDIDHFKAVNDRYGHQTGDFVLKDFTSIIDSSIRPYDLLGRYGGEEFIVVSTNTSGPDTASMIGRIMDIVNRRSFEYNGAKIRCTFSCGIADSSEFPPQELCISKLVDIADRRLYAAKDAGRNRLIGP
jgi:diguanylate cyclase (GGDEF)-like protein/PAS domain S-box-containing protein